MLFTYTKLSESHENISSIITTHNCVKTQVLRLELAIFITLKNYILNRLCGRTVCPEQLNLTAIKNNKNHPCQSGLSQGKAQATKDG